MKADKWSSNQTSNSVGNKYLVIRNVSKSLNYLVSYNWYDPILVRFELYIQYGCHVLTLFEDRIFIWRRLVVLKSRNGFGQSLRIFCQTIRFYIWHGNDGWGAFEAVIRGAFWFLIVRGYPGCTTGCWCGRKWLIRPAFHFDFSFFRSCLLFLTFIHYILNVMIRICFACQLYLIGSFIVFDKFYMKRQELEKKYQNNEYKNCYNCSHNSQRHLKMESIRALWKDPALDPFEDKPWVDYLMLILLLSHLTVSSLV